MLQPFLFGVIFTASLTASFFFWRFWRQTKDRLFLLFALAFFLLSVERIWMTFVTSGVELKSYLVRLVAFILILIAIVGKNSEKRLNRSSEKPVRKPDLVSLDPDP